MILGQIRITKSAEFYAWILLENELIVQSEGARVKVKNCLKALFPIDDCVRKTFFVQADVPECEVSHVNLGYIVVIEYRINEKGFIAP